MKKNAVNGITGDLYFDQNGDVNRPYALGVYQDQRLLPTFIQYKQIKDARVGKKVFKKVLNGEYIVLDRKLMSKFHVIYTDIELNRITNLNIENGVCTLDFYIWFLFSGDLDTANIEFTNSIRPVYLNKPVLQKTVNQVTMRVYHVKAAFNLDVRLEKYPYNSHVIPHPIPAWLTNRQSTDTR